MAVPLMRASRPRRRPVVGRAPAASSRSRGAWNQGGARTALAGRPAIAVRTQASRTRRPCRSAARRRPDRSWRRTAPPRVAMSARPRPAVLGPRARRGRYQVRRPRWTAGRDRRPRWTPTIRTGARGMPNDVLEGQRGDPEGRGGDSRRAATHCGCGRARRRRRSSTLHVGSILDPLGQRLERRDEPADLETDRVARFDHRFDLTEERRGGSAARSVD